MHSHVLSAYIGSINTGNWHGVAELMLSSAEKLANIGAEFLVAPCNTIHQAFDQVVGKSPLPWLHIAEEVALNAVRNGYKSVGLLGTRCVMEGPIYSTELNRMGMQIQIPGTNDRERLDRLIFEDMVHGRFTERAKQHVLGLISAMKTKGCDAAGLCCKELPLLLKDAASPLPLIDSTKILASSALAVLSGERCLAKKPNMTQP